MTAVLAESERQRFETLYSSAGLLTARSRTSEQRLSEAGPTPPPNHDCSSRDPTFPAASTFAANESSPARSRLEWMDLLRNLPPVAEALDHETHGASAEHAIAQIAPADEWAESLAGTRERIRNSRAARGTAGTLQQIVEQSQLADRTFVTGAVTEACHMYDELLAHFQSSCNRKAPVAIRAELARCFKNRAACFLCSGRHADAQSDLLSAFRLSDNANFKSLMMERLKEIRASAANQRQQVSSTPESVTGSTSKWKKRRQKKNFDVKMASSQVVSTVILPETGLEKGGLAPGAAVTECSICLEDLASRDEDTYETPCGHAFHESCIEEWQETCEGKQFKMSCPNCRSMFSWHLFGRKAQD